MTFFAEDCSAHLGLEGYLVVFAAIIANDLKPLWRLFPFRSFFRAALCASLRRHHISLVKRFLLFLCEHEYLFTLNTRDFNVGHFDSS
jgi:hypothetical protein